MAEKPSGAETFIQPYRPSWIDRFNDRVEDRWGRVWSFYALFGFTLIAVQLLFLWPDGGLGEAELLPVVIFNGLFTPFLLGLLHYLDRQALAALGSMRPLLDATDAEFGLFAYRLSTMPAPRPLLAGLAMLIIVVIMEQLGGVPTRYAALARLPTFNVVFQIVDKSSAVLFGVFLYHTIRQLRLVDTILVRHIHINLYNLEPVQGFSRLTAATAVGLVIGVYGFLLINPELLTDPVVIGFAVLITVLALFVFIWPLYGVHRRMEEAKERALQEIDLRFEAVFARFNQRFAEDDYAALETLNGTISSLEIQRRRIEAVPTWPWSPETLRSALAAIALPLVLMIVQLLVEGAFGR